MKDEEFGGLSHSEHPMCEQCDKPMCLIRIDPVQPGCEKRTYECPQCGRKESILAPRSSPLRSRVG